MRCRLARPCRAQSRRHTALRSALACREGSFLRRSKRYRTGSHFGRNLQNVLIADILPHRVDEMNVAETGLSEMV